MASHLLRPRVMRRHRHVQADTWHTLGVPEWQTYWKVQITGQGGRERYNWTSASESWEDKTGMSLSITVLHHCCYRFFAMEFV